MISPFLPEDSPGKKGETYKGQTRDTRDTGEG
jgi:hypothetical protein